LPRSTHSKASSDFLHDKFGRASKRGRGRVNVMGALRYNDKKRICFMIKKGNPETFHEQLKKLHEEIRQEWISRVNLAEDFREKDRRLSSY
jgi:transposase